MKHSSLLFEDNPNVIQRNNNIRPTPDGGTLQIGTWGNGEFSRAMISKYAPNSSLEWSFRLNVTLTSGNSWQVSYGADALPLEDGSYALLAAVNQSLLNAESFQNLDMAFIRFSPPDSDGNAIIHDAQVFGGDFADIPHQMERTKDNGYALIGISNTEQALNLPSRAHTYLVKLNAAGELEWDRRYGSGTCETGAFSLLEGVLQRSLCVTQDNGLVFSTHCGENTFISKVDTDGEPIWTRRLNSSNSLFDGAYNEDWNAVLGAGAGTGGTIAQVLELPDGKLAFLGNQFSYFFFLFGNEVGSNGTGAALPMSYCFITDADGAFLYGNAFFRQTSGQPNNPIEMLAQDMVALPNGHLLISSGIQSYVNGGVSSIRPALLELNPQAEEFDEAIVNMHALGSATRFTITDYPWGMDRMSLFQFAEDDDIHWAFEKHAIQLNELASLGNSDFCIEPIPSSQLRSLPLDLDLVEGTLPSVSLATESLTIHSMTPLELEQMTVCAETITDTTDPMDHNRSPAVVLAPTTTSGDFQLIVKDPDWLGAEVAMFAASGQLLYRYRLFSERPVIPTIGLPAGLYYILIDHNGQQLQLKAVMATN